MQTLPLARFLDGVCKMYKIGVRVLVNNKKGIIAGYGIMETLPYHEKEKVINNYYLVKLYEGFWDKEEKNYISSIIAHPDNIQVL